MHEAQHYSKKDNKIVQCNLCPKNCLIKENSYGNCGVRKNVKGKLISEVYAKAVSLAIDPIEKKPLFNFFPGTDVLSFGTAGCNLHCRHCQNYSTSQIKPEEILVEDVMPEEIVGFAMKRNCKSIAATYNEPTVFYEYMQDTFKIARKNEIKTVSVTNGFINEEPLKELLPYLDAANVDLKAFNNKFYQKITSASLEPVLRTLKILNKSKAWLEITNLMIPSLNDNIGDIKRMCKWIKDNLSPDVPLHFTAFYPCYQLMNVPPTPKETLIKAREVAKKAGLKHVYTGNAITENGEDTFCSGCGEILIRRERYNVQKNNVLEEKCRFCGKSLEGFY